MSGIIPDILAVDIASDAEAAFQIMEDIANSLKGLAFGLTGRHDHALALDTINGDPPNTAPSFIVPDSDILRDDQWNGYEFVMTSGVANGTVYVITDVTESDNRIHVAENLFADGVLDGDTFRLKGHRHNGQIGREVDVKNIIGFIGSFWPKDSIRPITSGSCPTGWTDISATYNGRYLVPGANPVATGGTGFHTHPGSGVSAGVNAGALAPPQFSGVAYNYHSGPGTAQHFHEPSALDSITTDPLFRTIKLCKKN